MQMPVVTREDLLKYLEGELKEDKMKIYILSIIDENSVIVELFKAKVEAVDKLYGKEVGTSILSAMVDVYMLIQDALEKVKVPSIEPSVN